MVPAGNKAAIMLVGRLYHKNNSVQFKFYDVTAWLTKNCKAHTAQYLNK